MSPAGCQAAGLTCITYDLTCTHSISCHMIKPFITVFQDNHWQDLLDALSQEPEWESFTSPSRRDQYRIILADSLSLVCYQSSDFCGFVRAIIDHDLAIYISELYVRPIWRNLEIGQKLLSAVKNQSPGLPVYVLSDIDDYYQGKGYQKAGSVFLL